MKYLILFILPLLINCSPLRHYEAIAVDTNVTPKKKGVIAPWVASNFPVTKEYIQGVPDTVTELLILEPDTLISVNHDTTLLTITTAGQVITKTIRRIDTVHKENSALTFQLQNQLAIASSDILDKESEIIQLKDDVNGNAKKRRNLWWTIVALSVALAGSIYLNFKRK